MSQVLLFWMRLFLPCDICEYKELKFIDKENANCLIAYVMLQDPQIQATHIYIYTLQTIRIFLIYKFKLFIFTYVTWQEQPHSEKKHLWHDELCSVFLFFSLDVNEKSTSNSTVVFHEIYIMHECRNLTYSLSGQYWKL
jgi:hypothetical protein